MSDPTERPPTQLPAVSNKPAAVWQDRRGMFQRGKEVHESGTRRMSQSGAGIIGAMRRASTASSSSGSLVDKPLSNDPTAPGNYPTASDARRRSSTASSSLFGNLIQHKRGSEDYEKRRASQSEQLYPGGLVAGWYNSYFKGIKKSQAPQKPAKSEKRGVME